MPVQSKFSRDIPEYVDVLDEDKPIAQQKFVCMSFISPENVIRDKNQFCFDQFVKSWDMTKSFQKYSQFTAFLAYKYNLDTNQVTEDLNEFCKEESSKLSKESIYDDYKTFMDINSDKLDEEYLKQHNFQTNVRGVKVRGVFPSQAEAEMRAKLLRESDPNFDVYVGPVGVWMPWEPDAYKTGNVNFLEPELNELMTNKNKNEESAREYFQDRVKESKKRAIEENKAKAAQNGNKLTQNVTDSGELVGVNSISSTELHKRIFENENVVTKMSDHGLSQLS
jgi:hypothetical protein